MIIVDSDSDVLNRILSGGEYGTKTQPVNMEDGRLLSGDWFIFMSLRGVYKIKAKLKLKPTHPWCVPPRKSPR